jgi:hypothetical protein
MGRNQRVFKGLRKCGFPEVVPAVAEWSPRHLNYFAEGTNGRMTVCGRMVLQARVSWTQKNKSVFVDLRLHGNASQVSLGWTSTKETSLWRPSRNFVSPVWHRICAVHRRDTTKARHPEKLKLLPSRTRPVTFVNGSRSSQRHQLHKTALYLKLCKHRAGNRHKLPRRVQHPGLRSCAWLCIAVHSVIAHCDTDMTTNGPKWHASCVA